MSRQIKTYKKWEKSNKNLDEYLQPLDQIDEELYNYLGEIVPAQYSSENFVQNGEAEFERYETLHYMTGYHKNGKYFYLGVLPEFKQ